MTTEKILAVVAMYRDRLEAKGIPEVRMNPKRTFRDLTTDQVLAHAHYLLDDLERYAQDPELKGKTGRHLSAVQMCLSFAGWYTLEELMNHNRPDNPPTT